MNIAIIPARGGSKRIARKNIRDFLGQPIIAYSIRAARESGCFARVLVSTDDAEIAAVARDHGAETPFERPAELADDHATLLAVMRHGAHWLQGEGVAADFLCCLLPTAPFLQPEQLRDSLERLQESGVNYLFSATPFPYPVQRGFTLPAAGGVQMLFPEHRETRSQDLEPVYHDAGQFYWGRAAAFAQARPVFSSDSRVYLLPRQQVRDIDSEADWREAELMYRLLREVR